MKKIILFVIAFIALTTAIRAQQQEKPFIEVSGVTTYNRTPDTFRATLIVSEDIVYNSEGNERFLELKKIYLNKVKANQIAVSRLKENEFQYLTTGYNKDGTIFTFETTSKEEFIKFLRIKSTGVVIYNKYVTFKPIDIDMLSKNALNNERQRAEKIAKNTNKKVGEIIAIKDENITAIRESIYEDSLDTMVNYKINVRFELLN